MAGSSRFSTPVDFDALQFRNEAMYLTMNLLTVSKYAIQLGVYKSE